MPDALSSRPLQVQLGKLGKSLSKYFSTHVAEANRTHFRRALPFQKIYILVYIDIYIVAD